MLDSAVPTLVRLLAACGPPVPPQYNRVVSAHPATNPPTNPPTLATFRAMRLGAAFVCGLD